MSARWILAFSLNLANQRPYVDEEVNIYSSGPGLTRPKPHDHYHHEAMSSPTRPSSNNNPGHFYTSLNSMKPTSGISYQQNFGGSWEQENRPNDLNYDRPYDKPDRPEINVYQPIDDYSQQDDYDTSGPYHRPQVQHQDTPSYQSPYRGNG